MDTAVASTNVSLQNILFATDFSVCSEAAFSYAIKLCRRYGSTLHTVHVVREELSDVQPPDPFYLLHSAQRKMASLVREDPFQGVKHRELLREGDVAQVLSDLTATLGINLMVLGTHGRGGLKKLLLGSIAEEILGCASCPVLMVGPHVLESPGMDLEFRRILYATDLRNDCGKTLAFAIGLAEREHGRLTVMHVVKPQPDAPGDYLEAGNRRRQKSVSRNCFPSRAKSNSDFVVEVGMPAEMIASAASRLKADLIVMGAHHGSARVSAHLPWVTPHQVICQAPCPVVTVRES